MLKEVFIKIGQQTIKIYKNLSKNKQIVNEEKIENKTFNELIKQNKNKENKINKDFLFIPLLFITVFIITKSMDLSLKLGIILIGYPILKSNIPKIKSEKRKKEIVREFPYALRQISTQLKAGIGLYDSMKSIADSNYGILSEEFQITLNEIQYGSNYVESFENLSKRINLPSIEKFVGQIIRTLNNGGNLAETLNTLADENSSNMKIKYKEYSEKLNAIMLLYMFIAVLFPVILFILIIAATTVMGSIVQPELLLILYLFFFPLIISFMIILIKRLEPSID
ncbi:type II secretion system F family protein [Methanosphaera sp.]|uniref:type II secretion system F family protein n=1 Tax=Methanosphaera sp. TaxID=2666342 RepID=UPI0025EC5D8C|nr:type II secretion system F family protein [Methanosphaera sp.]